MSLEKIQNPESLRIRRTRRALDHGRVGGSTKAAMWLVFVVCVHHVVRTRAKENPAQQGKPRHGEAKCCCNASKPTRRRVGSVGEGTRRDNDDEETDEMVLLFREKMERWSREKKR
jgi:hypothetical protein